MESIIHRFKQSLRLNLKIWKDDLNLICISGGSCSMALLDLLHDSLFGTSSQTQRKMFFRVHVLYIDEGPAVYNWSDDFHNEQIELIKQICEKYEFTYSIVPIESIFDIDFDLKQPTPEERAQFDEEKKQDYETHTTLADSFESVKNVHV